MMWATAAFILVFAGLLGLIVTEVLRSVIDRRRVQRDGMGGTHDIAIAGMIVCTMLFIAAAVCALFSFLS